MARRRRRLGGALLVLAVPVIGAIILWQMGCLSPPTPVTSTPSSPPSAQGGEYRAYIYGGLPKTTQQLRILRNTGYMVGYSENHRNPAWVSVLLALMPSGGRLPEIAPRTSLLTRVQSPALLFSRQEGHGEDADHQGSHLRRLQ